eukprot:1531397-Alexandrium_andersonii.AAC.1
MGSAVGVARGCYPEAPSQPAPGTRAGGLALRWPRDWQREALPGGQWGAQGSERQRRQGQW